MAQAGARSASPRSSRAPLPGRSTTPSSSACRARPAPAATVGTRCSRWNWTAVTAPARSPGRSRASGISAHEQAQPCRRGWPRDHGRRDRQGADRPDGDRFGLAEMRPRDTGKGPRRDDAQGRSDPDRGACRHDGRQAHRRFDPPLPSAATHQGRRDHRHGRRPSRLSHRRRGPHPCADGRRDGGADRGFGRLPYPVRHAEGGGSEYGDWRDRGYRQDRRQVGHLVISFDEALALIAEAAKPFGTETVFLAEAHGFRLAEPVIAQVDSPPRDVSAMDGYAVREAELPGRLPVAGTAWPGGKTLSLAPGSCIRIFTGGPVPDGADRIVIQEEVARDGDMAAFGEAGGARHIRKRGADFALGTMLLDVGRRLDPRALVAAAGADLGELEVWRQPQLAIFGTGDELAEPGRARERPGAIPESLLPGIAALAEEAGGSIVMSRRLKDNLPELVQMAGWAMERANLVVVTGGASVGEKDYAKAMFAPHGLELIFSKV